ncbi:CotS family spore coat protein [Tumebacillus lipolyticus]|uniref:CotS family spore coat protein n=1 Tax=Tumebacillus lipolyticus TaxID=1280370 RepID=A0ABW4ZUV4_9BACL
MADNSKNSEKKGQDWLKLLLDEFMKPPKWLNDGKKQGGSSAGKSGKKNEADVSITPKRRQPPAWWSWSASDGVPKARRKKKKRELHGAHDRGRAPAPKKLPLAPSEVQLKKKNRPADRLAPSDLGSALPSSPTGLHAQISRHGFAPAVLRAYGITPTKVEPFGPVLRLRTNKGLIALKKSYLRSAHIAYLHQVFKHLEQNQFKRYAPFLLTTKGLPYAEIGGDTYYATRWIRGQEVDFRSRSQLAITARTLAEFHRASRGFEPSGFAPPSIFDMVERFADRRDELIEWKRRAEVKSRPDAIDKIYLQHADHHISQAQQALAILKRPQVRAQLLFEEDDPPLLHLDLTPYNLIYAQNHQVIMIDFDFATPGPRTLDLAHLMRRGLQRQEWDEAVARLILVNYSSAGGLQNAEYQMLSGLLRFPHRFWRIGYQHYDLGHDPNHLGYFQLAEAEEENRLKFLERFDRNISRTWS